MCSEASPLREEGRGATGSPIGGSSRPSNQFQTFLRPPYQKSVTNAFTSSAMPHSGMPRLPRKTSSRQYPRPVTDHRSSALSDRR